MVAIGSLEAVCDKLLETRERLGITYYMSPVGANPKVACHVPQPSR